jgi:hypothetical protein
MCGFHWGASFYVLCVWNTEIAFVLKMHHAMYIFLYSLAGSE